MFSHGEFDVGRTNLVSHRIPTGDSKPVWHVRSPAELAKLQKNCPDVGFITHLRLESDEQPPFDVIRGQSENTKMYWSQWSQLVVASLPLGSLLFVY